MSMNMKDINPEELNNVEGGARIITSRREIDEICRVMARMCELGRTNEAGSYLIYAVPNDPTAVSLFKSGGVEAVREYLLRRGRTDLIFPGGHDTGPFSLETEANRNRRCHTMRRWTLKV